MERWDVITKYVAMSR